METVAFAPAASAGDPEQNVPKKKTQRLRSCGVSCCVLINLLAEKSYL